MDANAICRRVEPLLDPGETVRWTGRSSWCTYLPGQVPFVIFAIVFSSGTTWNIVQRLLLDRGRPITPFDIGFSAIGLGMLAFLLLHVVRDLSVSWAISDRRIYRIAGRTITTTDMAEALSLGTRPRSGGRGDLLVHLPSFRDSDGDRHDPVVRLGRIDDLQGACAAATFAISHPLRSVPGD